MIGDIFNRSTGETFMYLIKQDYDVGGGGILGEDGKVVTFESLRPKVGDIIEGTAIQDTTLAGMPSGRGIFYILRTSVDKTTITIPESSLKLLDDEENIKRLPVEQSDTLDSSSNKNIIAVFAASGAMAGLITAFMFKKGTKQYILFGLAGAIITGLIGTYIAHKINKT